jgi:hypothetical protein
MLKISMRILKILMRVILWLMIVYGLVCTVAGTVIGIKFVSQTSLIIAVRKLLILAFVSLGILSAQGVALYYLGRDVIKQRRGVLRRRNT